MDPDVIAPFVIVMTIILATAGVLIFRPLSKRLGDLIEMAGRNQRAQLSQEDLSRITDIVGPLIDRIERLEERQDFSERMLAALQQRQRAELSDAASD